MKGQSWLLSYFVFGFVLVLFPFVLVFSLKLYNCSQTAADVEKTLFFNSRNYSTVGERLILEFFVPILYSLFIFEAVVFVLYIFGGIQVKQTGI